MRNLYTLAYPDLAPAQLGWIEAFRRAHDPQYGIARPHFTLVFGCSQVSEEIYTAHVNAVTHALQPIPFVCRYAMPWFEANGLAYAFLVPDEGYSDLSRLHDDLHGDPLAASLRRDVPFVPHITIGSCADPGAVRGWCRELNRGRIEVAGIVSALTVATLETNAVSDIARFKFATDD